MKGVCAQRWFLDFFFSIRLLNPFKSSTRRTCSRTEPNYDLQDRLDLTEKPEGSTRPNSGSRKEPSLRPLTSIACQCWRHVFGVKLICGAKVKRKGVHCHLCATNLRLPPRNAKTSRVSQIVSVSEKISKTHSRLDIPPYSNSVLGARLGRYWAEKPENSYLGLRSCS